MKTIMRIVTLAMLFCVSSGIVAQDIITHPKKSTKKSAVPAKKQKAKANLTPEQMFNKGNAAYKRNDYSEAEKWYRKAGDEGHHGAISTLAYWYYEGSGVAKNYAESAKWYLKFADHFFAQLMLGKIYFSGGYGVEKDYSEALKWFRKAADQDDAESQFYVGWMFENGWGVAKNLDEARKWYRKAAKKSYYSAEVALKRLG